MSLRRYAKFLHDRTLMEAFVLSLELAAATVVVAGTVGTAAPLALVRGGLPGQGAPTAQFLPLPTATTGAAAIALRPERVQLVPQGAGLVDTTVEEANFLSDAVLMKLLLNGPPPCTH